MDLFDRALKLTEEESLGRSLPIALQLANTLADRDWSNWIRLELMGYYEANTVNDPSVVVPPYRAVSGQWHDDYGNALHVEHGISFVNEIRLRCGVAELESIASRGPGSVRMRSLDHAKIIKDALNVDVSIFEFSQSSVIQTLTNIRVHSLEQLMKHKASAASSVQTKAARQEEIFIFKPSFYGVGFDAKALWRRLTKRD